MVGGVEKHLVPSPAEAQEAQRLSQHALSHLLRFQKRIARRESPKAEVQRRGGEADVCRDHLEGQRQHQLLPRLQVQRVRLRIGGLRASEADAPPERQLIECVPGADRDGAVAREPGRQRLPGGAARDAVRRQTAAALKAGDGLPRPGSEYAVGGLPQRPFPLQGQLKQLHLGTD